MFLISRHNQAILNSLHDLLEKYGTDSNKLPVDMHLYILVNIFTIVQYILYINIS